MEMCTIRYYIMANKKQEIVLEIQEMTWLKWEKEEVEEETVTEQEEKRKTKEKYRNKHSINLVGM